MPMILKADAWNEIIESFQSQMIYSSWAKRIVADRPKEMC